ncbi:hypothetical protein ACKKBG_A29995 [Auxenochlorella protothecoides x Auxenochlorella symbiontica]
MLENWQPWHIWTWRKTRSPGVREREKRPSPPGHIFSETLPVLSPAHQVEGLTKELTSIVDWFSQLQAIDVEGVPPALQADVDSQDWQRPDEPHTFENRESLVSQFPATEGPFLSVPRTAPGTSEG